MLTTSLVAHSHTRAEHRHSEADGSMDETGRHLEISHRSPEEQGPTPSFCRNHYTAVTATGATSLQNVKTGQKLDMRRNRESTTPFTESPRSKLRTARPRTLTCRRYKQETSTTSQVGALVTRKVGGRCSDVLTVQPINSEGL